MSLVLDAVRLQARFQPDVVVLDDGYRTLTAHALLCALESVREWVQAQSCRSIALAGDNSLSWIICDLALLDLPVRVIPLPTFFSSAQIEHVLQQSQVDTVPAMALDALMEHGICAFQYLDVNYDIVASRRLPDAIATDFSSYEKITFTSGSTGTAKGVRLTLDTLEQTANAVANALRPLTIASHLGVLPFATLLENIAGLYAPLLQGVCIHVRRQEQLGLASPAQFNPFLLLSEIQRVRPQATILVPQLLLALVSLLERGLSLNGDFRFIAVGGGKVSTAMLEQARTLGLPVYEGYGLSECGSVVALNLPGADRVGSVGKPMSHCGVRVNEEGEILVRGSAMSGYLGEAISSGGEIATGDLGHIDADGFLHVSGRKKNMFITAFGRNVNPEWVEAELLRHLPVRQVAVFGEAMPRNRAVIVARAGYGQADVAAAVTACNLTLPDYARIGRVLLATEPFTVENGLATANGRVRRGEVEKHFQNFLQQDLLPSINVFSVEE
ncbi:MAG TPA: AMP-binding protein [Dongiaceae bacterium]|nr:AMP-binding protein [Dongiaceae bacterium]